MPLLSRRQILQAGTGALLSPFLMTKTNASAGASPLLLVVPAAAPRTAAASGLHLGTTRRPDGREISADEQSLRQNGARWLPVAGEYHFARYPASEWRNELLKMKAGGLDIVATYVFWIHHEEEEGRWDWTERRSLREFASECRRADLHLIVRIGPWCHGEVRNGGFPDWLLQKGFHLRSDDVGYLAAVQRLYDQIAHQLHGLLWKDGGPVIGIQVENEFHGPAEHLLTLKRLAVEAGMDVPFYTRTGWPALSSPMPYGELLPLYGGYPDGFWDRSLAPMPGEHADSFVFSLAPGETTAAIGTDQLGAHRAGEAPEAGRYPYLCCEIGGGMETSYHRRIQMAPADIEASALVKIGSGNCLQGYYMYHGGVNPEGRLSTLQESQASGYWNDLPVKSYDFQAPLGEFGQVREHYHRLRRLHLFLRDYGTALAHQAAHLPEVRPANAHDTHTLRWSVRTDGKSGYLFVNNYQRLQPLPAKDNIQFRLNQPGGEVTFPTEPVTVPVNASFFWPFGMDLDGATLRYATAQPICRLEDGNSAVYHVFAETSGIPAEFVFDANRAILESAAGEVIRTGEQICVRSVRPGTSVAIRLRTTAGKRVSVLLLSESDSLACWKGTLQGRDRLFLTQASLLIDGDRLRLSAEAPAALTIAIFPAPKSLAADHGKARQSTDGLFQRWTFAAPGSAAQTITIEPVKAAGAAREVPIGRRNVAEAPADADFDTAGVWRIRLPQGAAAAQDTLLRIRYVGDVARLYLDGKLLTDNFYNGDPFEAGLRRYAPDIYSKELLLRILPLRQDAPIYLSDLARDALAPVENGLQLSGVDLIERHEIWLTATPL